MRSLVAAVALLVGLVWTAPAGTVQAATIRNVPGTYATIQDAIDASDPGDTIRVAAGTYVGHATTTQSLTIESVGGPEVTTLDGAFDGEPIIKAGLEVGESLTVSGFRFWRGGATGTGLGGAIRVAGAGSATITANLFEANNAQVSGGAVYTALSGASSIDGNTFLENHAPQGGALTLFHADATVVTNNLFVRNLGTDAGGAIAWIGTSASPGVEIRSNTIANNDSSTGGAIYAVGYVANGLVRNNVMSGAIMPALVYCNPDSGGGPTFETNDVYNTVGPEYTTFCDAAPSDVSVDPVYADPDWDDFHLRADSPLIDAGTADAAITADIDGDARPFDGDESGGAQIDIGADEALDPLLVAPGSQWFGTLEHTQHADRSFTLQNLGSGTLSVTSVAITGDGAAEYAIQSQNCTSGSLSVDETCTVVVRFAPTSSNSVVDAFLTITGPGAVGTRNQPLSGVAVDPVQVSGAGFGGVSLGTTGHATFTIDNQSASQSISVSAIQLGGSDAALFAVTDDSCADGPIAAGASCAIHVSFTPDALGTRTADITVTGPAPVGTRHASLEGEGVPPATPVTWATPTKPGSSYTWTFGNALARSTRDGSQRLHQAYATDRVSGTWAKDSGPYAGIYYTRSTSGSTWTTPRRINPTSKHAIRFGIAAAGSRVYVAYVTQTKVVNFSPSAARVLYVRRNTNYGNDADWKSPIRLTGTTGRVDYPTIAASGTDVHVAFTNSNNGDIIVATSKDRGVTWAKRTIGSTSYTTTAGRVGVPSIAVSGSTVAVTWLASGNGALVTRISTDRGSTWGTTEEHTGSSVGDFHTTARGAQVAVAFVIANSLYFRIGDAAGWEDPRELTTDGTPYSPAVALLAPSRVAVTWAETTPTANFNTLRYRESTDNGATWYGPQTIASTSSSTRRANDWPSIVWPSAGTRYVSWNGWTSGTNNYRQYMRKGTGTAAGLATVAPVAQLTGRVTPWGAMPVPKADERRSR